MFHNKIIVFALLLTGCTLICAAQIDVSLAKADLPAVPVDILPTPEDVEKKTTSTTTSTTTTTTTTPAPTTSTSTTSSSTSTTTSTTTTTPAPSTTTKAPTTTAKPTAPPTTPAPAPAPYPEPSIGQWNSSCIMVKLAAQLNFTYETKDKNTTTALYNIPTDAVVDDSHCDNITQTIQINWGPPEAQHTMLLQFDMKNKTTQLTMMRFIVPIVGDRFPDAMANQTIQLVHMGFDFESPAKMSYHCTRAQQFNLTETVINKEVVGTVMMRDVQVEAFRPPNNSTVFSIARDCDSAETPDIVPIAVGIALVALIMIVLISYLCARRRSTSRGYMSF